MLKNSLRQKGISLRQLSRQIKIDVSTLSRIFNDKQKPNINHLEKLAEALELPLDKLLIATGYNLTTYSQTLSKIANQGKIEDEDIFEICAHMEGEQIIGHIEKELDKYSEYMRKPEGKAMILDNFEDKLNSIGQIGPIIDALRKLYDKFMQPDLTMTTFILIGSGLLYFIISPDIIPDFLFPLGFIDDVIAINIITNQIAKIDKG